MTAHTLYKCPDSCDGCQFCNGGLAYCTVCHGAEGSLPTECPGRPMDGSTQEAVYSGDLDYQGGKWVSPIRCWSCKVLTNTDARLAADWNCEPGVLAVPARRSGIVRGLHVRGCGRVLHGS